METMNSETVRFARQLGQQLVSFERCEDPKAHRNIDPPSFVNIRPVTLIPLRPVALDLADVRAHNSFVASLGRDGRKFE